MDHALVERAQRGDERAFEALTVSSHARSFAIAFGILRDAARAEEATQRAYLETWRTLPRLHDTSHYSGWSTRHLLEACRAEADAIDALPQVEADAVTAWPASAQPFGASVDRTRLAQAFDGLGFDERAALVLRYLAELPPDAIGLALDLEPGAALGRVSSAMSALERALDPEIPGPQHVPVQLQGA